MIPIDSTEYRTPEEIISAGSTEGETGPNHIANLYEIKKSINYNKDSRFREKVLSEFFAIESDFDSERPRLFTPRDVPSIVDRIPGKQPVEFDAGGSGMFDYKNDYDTDLKNHHGQDWFDLFTLFNEKGTIELDEVPKSLKERFNKVLESEKQLRIKTLQDTYVDQNMTENYWVMPEKVPDKTLWQGFEQVEENIWGDPNEFTEQWEKDRVIQKSDFPPKMKYIGLDDLTLEPMYELDKPASELIETKFKDVNNKMGDYMRAYGSYAEKQISEYNSLLDKYNISSGKDFKLSELQEFLDNQNIPLSTRKQVFEKQLEVVNVLKDFQQQALAVGDGAAVLESLNKNYSNTYAALLSLQRILTETVDLALFGGELLENFASTGDPSKDARIGTIKAYRNAHMPQAYYMLDKAESNLSLAGKVENTTWDNFGSTVTGMLADNTFSLIAAFTYQGMIKRGLKRKAKKILTGTWMTVEGAGKLSRMEKLQRLSTDNIAFIKKQLTNPDIVPSEKIKYQKELEKQQRYKEYSTSQKFFASLMFGGIAAYAERVGTMRWVDDLIQTSKYLGIKSIKDGIRKTGKFLWMGPGTEVIEESLTLLGHNMVDQAVLKEDKSLIEGMDADFFANVIVTSLAIGAPQMSQNMKLIVGSHLKTAEERKKYTSLLEEYIDNLYILEEGTNLATREGIRLADRSILEQRNQEILQEVGRHDIGVFGKISELTSGEIKEVFDIARKQMAILRHFQDIGASGQTGKYTQKEKQRLQEEYDNLQAQKEDLLRTPEKNRLIKLEETHGKTNVTTKMYEDYGKHHYFNTIVRGIIKDKDKFKIIESREDLDEALTEAVQNGVISEEFKEQILAGYDGTAEYTGGNATFLPDGTILIFDENVRVNLGATNSIDREDAIQAAIHELGHIYDINNSLVKDNQVVEEARELVSGILDYVKNLYDTNRISEKLYNEFLARVNTYSESNSGQVDLVELLQIIATMKRAGMLSTEESSLNYHLKSFFNALHVYRFGENARFLRFQTTEDILRYIDNFNKKVLERKNISMLPPEEQEGIMLSAGTQRTPEKLIRIIKNKNSKPVEIKRAEAELLAQYNALALTAIRFDDRAGDIPRKNVVSALSVYLPNLIKRYVPGKAKFSTFVTSNIGPKNDTIYEEAKILAIRDGVKLDDPNIQDLAGDVNDMANTQNTFVQKINMLTDFSIVSTAANKIKALVKAKVGDTFKQVIQDYAGKVGELIFGIPAKKIMEGGANLTAVTKYEKGMPIPAEGQSIQRIFGAGENMSKFIKTLPLLNVARKTADINKVGENIDVSREVYGRAIGLKGRVQDYFYEDYTDPKALSKDPKVKRDAETSPGGRSLGLSSQTPVKILKPEFRNPTPETIEKVKQDFGITPKGEPNVYSRDIGQLLKAAAKTLSIGVSLSGAQRGLEERKAPKKEIAKVTTAQSKAAFSAGTARMKTDVMHSGIINLTFEGDNARADQLLKVAGLRLTFKHRTEDEINEYFDFFENTILKVFPRNMFGGSLKSFIKPSRRILPKRKGDKKRGDEILTLKDGRKISINDYFNEKRDDLIKRAKEDYDGDNKVVFGKPFEGEGAKYKYGDTFAKLYGGDFDANDPRYIKAVEKAFYDGTREEYNAIFASMHQQMMARINESIKADRTNATIWASYFTLVGLDSKHPWRMGAEWVLFTKKPIGAAKLKGGKISTNPKAAGFKYYEWEHAMMATRSYMYLLEAMLLPITMEDGTEISVDFDLAYTLVMENYKLIALDNYDDKVKLGGSGRQKTMGRDWQFLVDTFLKRYFDSPVAAIKGINGKGINPKSLFGEGRKTAAEIYNVNINGNIQALDTQVKQRGMFSKGTKIARGYNKNTKARGMSTFDFDETLIIDGKNFITATSPDGDVIKISSGQWPIQGPDLMNQGYTFDFKDFVNVRGGQEGPLLQKMKNQIEKYGTSNVFVLTARMQESDTAIHGWLKSKGITIPLKNITGLGNSTGEAKAMWMLEKFSEGYNDMYFVDDALPNVKAVKNVLEQLDIKSKVVQAKVNFSAGTKFNKILEEVTGISAKKRFSGVKARKRGADKGKFRFFIPPSHEDFVGLLYNFIGTGKMGNRHRDFFEKTLIKPLNTAFRELNATKQAIANDYKNLKKLNPKIAKQLNQKVKERKLGDYTYGDAVRIYLWDKHGYNIPGLSKSDQTVLVGIVKSDSKLKQYADTVNIISRQEKYVAPGDVWEIGDVRTDLIQATEGVNRDQFFTEFNNNIAEIFSKENLNKIEAAYGENVREALEDMIHRIKSGRRRPQGTNKNVNRFLDYLQASIGGVMFFNMRSSVLQQLSIVNFINFEDNNLFQAAKAFANQKQYWRDWVMIFNSDMLKQRRGGLTMDINYQDIASHAARSKQPIRAIIKRLLTLGFTPTQISDSMAIASGGATFYRNRVKTYLKQGLSQKEAEQKAFDDFQGVAESTQQSARPDMTSSQQNSVLGWFILGFQNVTSQYARIMKKSASDIINRRISPPYKTQRKSDMANVSRILYYGFVQNIIFYTLQTALFAALFNEDEDDEEFLKGKKGRILNGTLDSLLRGAGVGGAIVSTLKNMAFAFASERSKQWNNDESSVLVELLNVSPPLGIKARKIVNAEKTLNYNAKVIDYMDTFDIDNPIWSAATNYIEAVTTLPANRLYNKTQNLREATDSDNNAWQRWFMMWGWSQWNLGIEDDEIERIKRITKRRKKKKQL